MLVSLLWTPHKKQAVNYGYSADRMLPSVRPVDAAHRLRARMGFADQVQIRQTCLKAQEQRLVFPIPSYRLYAIPSFDRLPLSATSGGCGGLLP
jgi:hypothetical protein